MNIELHRISKDISEPSSSTQLRGDSRIKIVGGDSYDITNDGLVVTVTSTKTGRSTEVPDKSIIPIATVGDISWFVSNGLPSVRRNKIHSIE